MNGFIRITGRLTAIVLLTSGLQAETPTPPNFKVAIIGDSGVGSSFTSVLNLIKSEGAALVVHQGDFDYANNPSSFFSKVDSVLGANFPYVASVGNHDAPSWPASCSDADGCYGKLFKDRMARTGLVPDDPDVNDQKYAVTFNGLKMVFIGENGKAAEFAQFITTQLTDDDHIWKIASWHKNQKTMQIGGKTDEMGWDVYENSRLMGAIVVTGHEHSYERTLTLSSTLNKTVDAAVHPFVGGIPSNPNALVVAPGKTFVVVSGLGGTGIRNQDLCLPTTYPYSGASGCNYIWGKIYSSDQDAQFGVLFMTFNVDGDPYKARGAFKTISGQTIDQFEVRAIPKSGTPPPPPPAVTRCDFNGDHSSSVQDVQLLVNAVLSGTTASTYDMNRDGSNNVVDLQVLVNVILGIASCPA